MSTWKKLIERRIKEELESPDLDHARFQKAACDLLDHHLPPDIKVVPTASGSSGRDNGFDGEVRRHNGEDPAPLIVTTSKNPLANLKKNLKSAKDFGNKSKEVHFACRSELSERDIGRLMACAKDEGRTLERYDLSWFVKELKLAKNQDICKDLLGFYAFPPGLTHVTDSGARMPNLEVEFLGREEDIAWINQHAQNDCLVFGQPGIGKTSLLHEFVKEEKARFLASDPDVTEIADYLRDSSNFIIVVDDAHKRIDVLQSLMRVRQERDCRFRIVAISWPHEKAKVINALGPRTPEKELAVLDGKTIVAIVKSIKYKENKIGWTPLINAIREQANGRPGLAVTLAAACLKEQPDEQSQDKVIGDVGRGEMLRQYLFAKFDNPNTQSQIKYVLAAFALGGKAGVSHKAILKFLNLKPIDLASEIELLGQYAVLETHEDQDGQPFSTVIPGQLRGALAAQYFFSKNSLLNYRDLEVRNQSEMVRTMIEARNCGAAAPDLESLVQDSAIVGPELLAYYVGLGEDEAEHAVRLQPDNLDVLASALDIADALVLPKLLEKSKRALVESAQYDAPHSTTTLELKLQGILNRWVVGDGGSDIGLIRHQKLVKAMGQFTPAQKNFSPAALQENLAAAQLFSLMLSPALDISEAGETPNIIKISRGYLPGEMLRSCAQLWEPFLQTVEKLHKALSGLSSTEQDRKRLWDIVQQAAGHWTFDITKRGLAREDIDFMKETLSTVLPRILSIAKNEWGHARYFRVIAEEEGIELAPDLLQGDSVLDLVFPLYVRGEGHEEMIAKRETARKEIKKLALAIGKANAMAIRELAVWLHELLDKASRIETRMDGFSYLCEVLARQLSSPYKLVNELLELRSNSEVAVRLLGFVARDTQDETAVLGLIDRCLAQDEIRAYTLDVLIGTGNISDAVFQYILPYLGEATEGLRKIYSLCLLFESFPERLYPLFTHFNPMVALYVAINHWQIIHYAKTEPKPVIQHHDEWKKAVLGSLKLDLDAIGSYTGGGPSYWLAEIFAKEQDLAMQWMEALLQSKKVLVGYDMSQIFKKILPNLDGEKRLTLLANIQTDEDLSGYDYAGIVSDLINQDIEVYRELLSRDDLKEIHLEPLGLAQDQAISPEWQEMAVAAIKQGKTPGEIVKVILYPKAIRISRGSASEVLSGQLEKLKVLEGDTELGQVYRAAKKYLEPRIKKAEQQEIAGSNR